MKQANDGKGNFAGAALPLGRQRGEKTSDAYCKGSKITMLPDSRETELYRGLSRVLGNWLARF